MIILKLNRSCEEIAQKYCVIKNNEISLELTSMIFSVPVQVFIELGKGLVSGRSALILSLLADHKWIKYGDLY